MKSSGREFFGHGDVTEAGEKGLHHAIVVQGCFNDSPNEVHCNVPMLLEEIGSRVSPASTGICRWGQLGAGVLEVHGSLALPETSD